MVSSPLYLLRNLNRPTAVGSTDPATLNLTLLCEAAFAGDPWPGTASIGTSAVHSLASPFTGQAGTSNSRAGKLMPGTT